MIRRPPRSTHCISSAASDVYKRQPFYSSFLQVSYLGTHFLNFDGQIIFSGFTHSSNCSTVTKDSSKAACFNVSFFSFAYLAIFADLSYPIYGLSAVTNIKDWLTCYLILGILAQIPSKQFFVNDTELSPNKRIE
eukprot:TRINITY_DN16232_c0_g1_i1.p2 TRINITY_DN16232_c0_g1~~TRINITY_DN16232_c0_g1_i1.p2  ORF type:complete len:135 (+),score=31.50 TRINITY_DN16232_c0_g1_i1:145-549(+)